MNIFFTDEALEDLKNISDFISADSPKNAEKFIGDLLAKIQNIPDNPLIYRKSIYYDDANYRDLIFKKYTAVFKISNETIYILAIFRARKYRS